MATVEISVEDFRECTLPFVAVEGGAADHWYRYDAHHKPSWPVVFVLFGPVGWFVMIVAFLGLERKVTGYLPSTVAAQERLSTARWRAVSMAAACVAGVAGLTWLMAATGLWQLTLPPLLVALGALGWFGAEAWSPRGAVGLKLSRSGTTVELREVDPDFVDAYRRYRARLAAQRRALAADDGGLRRSGRESAR
jgi:hypothetical protein